MPSSVMRTEIGGARPLSSSRLDQRESAPRPRIPTIRPNRSEIVTARETSPPEAEILRRSIAIFPPQSPSGLSREWALEILGSDGSRRWRHLPR